MRRHTGILLFLTIKVENATWPRKGFAKACGFLFFSYLPAFLTWHYIGALKSKTSLECLEQSVFQPGFDCNK